MGVFHCHWYVTTRCNSRCSTCTIWSDPGYRTAEATFQQRLSLLYQLKRMGVKSIDFTGGEPLLSHRLPELMRRAHEMGIFTSLTTNGTLYKKYAHQLVGAVSALSFSLDGPTAEIHESIRRIKCFKSAIESILLARKLGNLVMIKTTVTNQNVKNLPEMIHLAQKLGVLIELNPEFGYFNNFPLEDDFIKDLFKWWRHPNVIISHAHLRFMLDGGNDIVNPRCSNGSTVVVISPDNKIYVPCMHKSYGLIPLVDGNLEKTLRAASMQNERLWMGRHPYCEGCTIPCYFEPTYYTKFDKYFISCLYSRIGYIIKRVVLTLKLKCEKKKVVACP
jgi:MoaA/NifB/PqqE/SkfB family radical SAM enzyme